MGLSETVRGPALGGTANGKLYHGIPDVSSALSKRTFTKHAVPLPPAFGAHGAFRYRRDVALIHETPWFCSTPYRDHGRTPPNSLAMSSSSSGFPAVSPTDRSGFSRSTTHCTGLSAMYCLTCLSSPALRMMCS